jgi:proteic killer suppression protein
MIGTFGNAVAEDLFHDRKSKSTRSFPNELRRTARRKLLYLHDATDLQDLRVPPGNRLESLKGNLKGFHSIRINDQWRLVFRWSGGQSHDVQILDYHK